MIKQGHINRAEAILLLWFTIAAKVLLSYPASMVADGLTGSWMIVLGSALVALAGFLPGILLVRRFEGLAFARAADEAGGLVVGKTLGFIVGVFLLALGSLVLREFTEAFVTSILPRTPIRVLTVTFALAVAYGAYAGLETLGRIATFLTPWLFVFFLIVILGAAPAAVPGRLFPLWGEPPLEAAKDCFLRSSLYAEILILPILYPYLRDKSEGTSVGVWAIALSAGILLVVQVMVVMVFDVVNTDRLTFPIINLARLVSFGRFVSRIEAAVVLLWIFVAAMQLAVVFWAAATTLAETLRLPDHRPLISPLTAVIVAGSLLPPGLRQAAALDFEYGRRWAWLVAFAAPAFVWLLAVIRGKSGVAGARNGQRKEGEDGGA